MRYFMSFLLPNLLKKEIVAVIMRIRIAVLIILVVLATNLLYIYDQVIMSPAKSPFKSTSSKLDSLRTELRTISRSLRNNVSDFCASLPSDSPVIKRHQYLREHYKEEFFLMRPIDLALCVVLKSASTTLLVHFIEALSPWGSRNRKELRRQWMQHLNASQIDLDSFAPITFIRHPLKRLLSAYRYVFSKPASGWDTNKDRLHNNKWLRDQILFTYRNISFVDDNMMVTPDEMVRYLVDKTKESGWSEVNRHLVPQWYSCPFCTVDFDFIGSVDNFESDFKALISAVNNSRVKQPIMRRKTTDSKSNFAQNFFENLSKSQVISFMELYNLDFRMLGIKQDVGKYLDMAHE